MKAIQARYDQMRPHEVAPFVMGAGLIIFILILLAPAAGRTGDYDIDLSEIEKKPYSLGGYAEFAPLWGWMDKEASLYRLNFYNSPQADVAQEYNSRLQLEGSLEKGAAMLFVRTNSLLAHTYRGWSGATKIYDGYLSLKPSPLLAVTLGKKAPKWGKGYAWNPVAFLDKPKNPDDPELSLEGLIFASADFTRSFDGPLKTVSLTPVLVPVYSDINDSFGTLNRLNFAAKLYLLLYDTDLDFIALSGGSKSARYGMDFSRNLTTNFEVHGEFAYLSSAQRKVLSGGESSQIQPGKGTSWLLGIRYLSGLNTTYILEYYHNEDGFTPNEMNLYFNLVDQAYSSFISTGSDSLMTEALGVSGNYGRINPMMDYLYLRISQSEPFNILYFTPAITAIFNADDNSFNLTPELLYTGITNLELRLKTSLISGVDNSEFGEKMYNLRLEFRARYYF